MVGILKELEHKFSLVADGFPEFDALKAAIEPLGLLLQSLGRQQQQDRYFDTGDRRLKRLGMALRIREVDGERLVGLKTAGEISGSLHRREELELAFNGGAWPAEIAARLKDKLDLSALRPVLDINTQRSRYLLWRGAVELAELAFDDCRVQRPGQVISGEFLELELEAKAATEAELKQIVTALDKLLPLTPNSINKLERAEVLLNFAQDISEEA